MTMYEITSILWARKLFLALVSAAVFVVGTSLVLLGAKTTYTARAEVLFDQPNLLGNVSGINVSGKFANLGPTFCRLMSSDDVVEEIARGSRVPESSIRGEVRCDPISQTMLVEITSTTGHAKRSRDLANAGAEALAETVRQRYANPLVPPREVVDAEVTRVAELPPKDPQSQRRQLALVAFGALFFGAAFTAAAEPYRSRPTDDEPRLGDSAERG